MKDTIVTIMKSDTDPDELMSYMLGGPLPGGARIMGYDEFAALGRVDDCDCSLIQCVCSEAKNHKDGCEFRAAMTCPIPIPCDKHHDDVCLKCNPCTCKPVTRFPKIRTILNKLFHGANA